MFSVVRYFLQILTVSSILLLLQRYFPWREDFSLLQLSSYTSPCLVTKLLLLQGILNGVCVLAEFMCVSNMPLGELLSYIRYTSSLPSSYSHSVMEPLGLAIVKGEIMG